MQVDAGLALHDRVVHAGGAVDEVEWCGRSSVIHPVSTVVMRMPDFSSISSGSTCSTDCTQLLM